MAQCVEQCWDGGSADPAESPGYMEVRRLVGDAHGSNQRRNGSDAEVAHGPGGRVCHLIDRAVEARNQWLDGARIAQYRQLPYDCRPTYFFILGLTQQCEERLKSFLTLR